MWFSTVGVFPAPSGAEPVFIKLVDMVSAQVEMSQRIYGLLMCSLRKRG